MKIQFFWSIWMRFFSFVSFFLWLQSFVCQKNVNYDRNSRGYELAKRFNSKFTHISPVWYDLKRYVPHFQMTYWRNRGVGAELRPTTCVMCNSPSTFSLELSTLICSTKKFLQILVSEIFCVPFIFLQIMTWYGSFWEKKQYPGLTLTDITAS